MESDVLAKLLIFIGLFCLLGGGLLLLFGYELPLGRLPGDIVIKGERGRFYFPIVSCLLISVVLNLIFKVFSKFL